MQDLDMSVVDELLSLTEDGDPELLLDLIQMFLDDAPTKVQSIVSGVTEGDMEQVARAAHSLKGSAGNLGVHLVQADCNELQNKSRANEANGMRTLANQLEGHFAQAVVALESLRSRYQ